MLVLVATSVATVPVVSTVSSQSRPSGPSSGPAAIGPLVGTAATWVAASFATTDPGAAEAE